jgi:ATP/maltotriose-dependent transcriptional regulator MalT
LLARLHDLQGTEVREYAGRLLAAFHAAEQVVPGRETRTAAAPNIVEGLTEREREILRLIAEGDSYQDIAQQLVIAVSTVQHHIKSLYTKLDVHSGLEAVARARRLGLLP